MAVSRLGQDALSLGHFLLRTCLQETEGSVMKPLKSSGHAEEQPQRGSVTEPLKSSGHAEEQPQRAADLFTPPSCCPYCIIVGLVGGLASGFVCAGVAFIIWKCKKSKNTSQAKLQEKLQKTRDKLDSVVYRITNLEYLKKTLENQRDQCRLQLEDVERKRGENKEKLQLVETFISESDREKATDKTERYLREKQILLNAQRELEKRKEEQEKLQLDTEKVLQSKDAVDNLSRLKERKRELEILIEELSEQLQEIQRKRN